MKKKVVIFVLSHEEVTLQVRNHIKKSYRKQNQEVECIFESEELFQMADSEKWCRDTIYCISFKRHYLVQMVRWIENIRQRGFQGRIVLSVSSSTFDYGIVPKFLAAGGSLILEEDEWKEDPLQLSSGTHSETINSWLRNRKLAQESEDFNEDAITHIFNELLSKDAIDMKTLAYIYEGLDKKHRERLMSLIKKNYRRWHQKLLKGPRVDFTGEGIITVLGNPEFSSELAVQIALESDRNVLLVDLDRLNPSLDMYCPSKKSQNKTVSGDLSDIQKLHSRQKISPEDYKYIYKRVPKIPSLKVVYGCGDLKKFEYYTNEALLDALAVFKRQFDVVVLNVNTFIYDAYTCIGIIRADVTLMPVAGDMATLRHYRRSMELLSEKQQIDLEKCWYIFFDCEEALFNELLVMTEIINGPVLGWIGRCKKRGDYRNMRKSYATNISKQSKKDYKLLLEGLNIT